MIDGLRAARCAAALVAIVSMAGAGCVSRPVQPTGTPRPWPQMRAELQSLARFELSGRVAVNAGSEGFNGALHWTQDRAHSRIELSGPLGSGGVLIDADGARLELATSRGERLDGEAARAELERRLGFALPLASLRYWLLGVPDPASPAEELLGSAPRLDHLDQAGWRIEYPLYMDSGGRALPRRLTLERPGARVKLVVDRWERGG